MKQTKLEIELQDIANTLRCAQDGGEVELTKAQKRKVHNVVKLAKEITEAAEGVEDVFEYEEHKTPKPKQRKREPIRKPAFGEAGYEEKPGDDLFLGPAEDTTRH